MGLNETTSGERTHIGFFGMRNAGKSALVNAVTGQDLSVVSAVSGTTTDPVKKAMELLPIGPVLIIDTPGFDDEGELGEKRVKKTREVIEKTDVAVLVVDASRGIGDLDRALLGYFEEAGVPAITVYNKSDLLPAVPAPARGEIYVSALKGDNVKALKNMIGRLADGSGNDKKLIADLLAPGDHVVLVTPIDAAAPKGRMILPQQQTMRDILDAHCTFSVCQPQELTATLAALKAPPRMVVTDSQAFKAVAGDTPDDVPLTSFSILFARYKGELDSLVRGAAALAKLQDGDRVLISEGCTHHRQCGDIGTEKLPTWIRAFTAKDVRFDFTSGGEFPADLSGVALVVHCGGCMLNEKAMRARMKRAAAQGVPMTNYGVAIAHMNGILERSLRPFPSALEQLKSSQ